jgi:hypothetical protein
MAAKKKTSQKSSIISAPKKTQSSLKKQNVVNEINKGKEALNKLGKGGSGVGRIAYEVTGAADLKRFVKNPSMKNATNLGVTIAAYAAGPALKAAAASKALKAGYAAEKSVMSTRAASLARPIPDKSMTFTRKYVPGIGPTPTGNLIPKTGKALPVSGFTKATTPRNVNRVTSGRNAAVNIKADNALRSTIAREMKRAAPAIRAGQAAGIAVAGSKVGTGTSKNSQNKNRTPKKK